MTSSRLSPGAAETPLLISEDRAAEAIEIAINIVGNIRSQTEPGVFELTGEEAAERVLAAMHQAQDEALVRRPDGSGWGDLADIFTNWAGDAEARIFELAGEVVLSENAVAAREAGATARLEAASEAYRNAATPQAILKILVARAAR